MTKFYPTQDFLSNEFQSVYLRGLSYTAKDDNPQLLAAVERWVADGLVSLEKVESEETSVELRGEGTISDVKEEDR